MSIPLFEVSVIFLRFTFVENSFSNFFSSLLSLKLFVFIHCLLFILFEQDLHIFLLLDLIQLFILLKYNLFVLGYLIVFDLLLLLFLGMIKINNIFKSKFLFKDIKII